MPQPVPTPTAEQLVIVAEITLLDYDTVATMVAADSDQLVSNAKWARTLTDIANWPSVESEGGDLKKVGSIEFFETAAGETRLDFRNKVRARYNQPLLTSETQSPSSESLPFGIRSQQWF
jgi:hypothetical protein